MPTIANKHEEAEVKTLEIAFDDNDEGFVFDTAVITPQNGYYPLYLGSNFSAGETFQCVIPAGCWFGAEVRGDGYSLVGCTVAPGFDFADFEIGNREELLVKFPEQTEMIQRLTKSTT